MSWLQTGHNFKSKIFRFQRPERSISALFCLPSAIYLVVPLPAWKQVIRDVWRGGSRQGDNWTKSEAGIKIKAAPTYNIFLSKKERANFRQSWHFIVQAAETLPDQVLQEYKDIFSFFDRQVFWVFLLISIHSWILRHYLYYSMYSI